MVELRSVGNLLKGLQIAQLHGNRAVRHDFGGVGEFLRGLKFTLRRDYFGTPFALGLGLGRNRALHVLGQIDVLQLDHDHLDSPRLGLRVDNFLDVRVEFFALAQEFVEFGLAPDRAQGGLRKLQRGEQVVAQPRLRRERDRPRESKAPR